MLLQSKDLTSIRFSHSWLNTRSNGSFKGSLVSLNTGSFATMVILVSELLSIIAMHLFGLIISVVVSLHLVCAQSKNLFSLLYPIRRYRLLRITSWQSDATLLSWIHRSPLHNFFWFQSSTLYGPRLANDARKSFCSSLDRSCWSRMGHSKCKSLFCDYVFQTRTYRTSS